MFYCLAVDGKHNSVVLLLPTQCVIDFKNGERLVYSDVVDWIDSLLIFYLIVVLLQRHILEKDSCSRPTQIHWRFVASKSLVLHCHTYRESRVYSSCPPKPRPSFVATLRRPVKPLVHSPEGIEASRVGGIGMIDDTVGECECAHTRRLAGIGGDVGARHFSEHFRRLTPNHLDAGLDWPSEPASEPEVMPPMW